MFNHQMFDLIRTKLAGLWSTDLKQNVAYAPRRPTGAALRNPADPIQAARIEAAEARRELRADKAHENADRSYTNNPCIGGCGCERFNPFYINY